MTALTERLDRTIRIHATRDVVFGFLTDTPRWAAWWGPGSTIDATPGGRMKIRYPDGTEASGEVVEVRAPERIVFTYGYASGTPIPPGASLVTIRLEDDRGATTLHLEHAFADAAVRDQHVQGWRYQLGLFSNIVADAVNAGAADLVDGWFAAWSEADAAAREAALARVAAANVRFHDRFGNTNGLDDLLPHIAAAQRFMPGFRMERRGDVRHCQGTVLASWTAFGGNGQERGRGTNVFVLDAAGRIESVTGFWEAV